MVPINQPGAPFSGASREVAGHRLRETPLPSQLPSRLRAPPGPAAAALSDPRPRGALAALEGAWAFGSGSGRTAIVMRVSAHVRPSSSLKRTSQTHVVRPRCMRVATACTWPCVMGRRKLVLFDMPIATCPSSSTDSAVTSDVIDSASDAYTPPCTSPNRWVSSSRTVTCARSPRRLTTRPARAHKDDRSPATTR